MLPSVHTCKVLTWLVKQYTFINLPLCYFVYNIYIIILSARILYHLFSHHSDVYIPGEDTGPHVHEQPKCAQEIHQAMDSCFSKFNMKPDMFLVNVTHDRSNFMGDANMAKSLCQ